MRKQDVLGRKIVAVAQRRVQRDDDTCRNEAWEVEYFVLDNGTVLSLVAVESEDAPFVRVVVTKTKKQNRRASREQ